VQSFTVLILLALSPELWAQRLRAADSGVKILYPPNYSVLPAYGFMQSYFAVLTATPSTCAYASQNVAYAQMTAMNNTGNQTFHSTQLLPAATGVATYYFSCRAESTGVISPNQRVTVWFGLMDASMLANIRVIGTSPANVLLVWSDPNPKTQKYKIYRNNVLVGTTQYLNYLDTGLTAGQIYYYSVSAVAGGQEGPQSIPAPAYTLPVTTTSTPALSSFLDDFKSGSLLEPNPTEAYPVNQYFWGQYAQGDGAQIQLSDGLAWPTTDFVHDGKYSLGVTLSGFLPPVGSLYHGTLVQPGMFTSPGTAYLETLPYSSDNNLWMFSRQFISSGTWQNDTYNRLRFWVKVPPGFSKFYQTAQPGWTTLQIGTYVTSSHANHVGSGGAEAGLGGNHYYHYFRVPATDQWQQVIMDAHPTHQRGASGNFEWGTISYPTNETGVNYFDALTRFYLDFSKADPATGQLMSFDSYPVTFYFDDVEYYKDTNPENVDQVYSMVGSYNPGTAELILTWSHPKDDGTTKHEVRYSFQDIYSLNGLTPLDKWNLATPAPQGVLIPPGTAYSAMEYRTTAIPVGSNKVLYVAVKPQGASTFRQMAIPTGQ
jgi:hypothetical protein